MRAADFGSDYENKPQPLYFNNFQGINTADDNANLLANQFPDGQNADLGRIIGSAAKRLGQEALFASLGAGGIKGQHVYQRSSGDIPLIGWGTDLYKLSGASNTVVKDTAAEFNAGTKTDITVLADDYIKPATVPTLAEGAAGLPNGAYRYKVSNIDKLGIEGALSEASNLLTVASKQIALSAIPTGPVGTTMRKVYRTKAGGSIYYALAFIGDNTTTTLADNTADASLTTEHVATRITLGTGITKGTEVITQAANTGSLSIAAFRLGQTITIPAGVSKLYSIAPYITGLGAGESLTLTLYADTTKAVTIGSATVAGAVSDGYIDFVLNVAVTPTSVNYFEFTQVANPLNVGNAGNVYAGGQAYSDGVAMPTVDLQFKVYASAYKLTGTYVSDAIDLTSAPSTSALSFVETLSSQLIAWYARGSVDNQNWGDWQAVEASGDGLPLTRYLQIKAVLTTDTATVTPIITSYTITYTAGYGTATSIKSGLSGNRICFVDWDDKCYFTDGGKPMVYDGTTVSVLGTGAATDPPACSLIHVHKNYFIYKETAAPSRGYVSQVGTPAVIDPANYFQEPDDILGMTSFDDKLIFTGKQFTEVYTGTIFDLDPSGAGDWNKISNSNVGCVSHDAIRACVDAQANDILIMPVPAGLKYLVPGFQLDSLLSVPLSRNVQHYFDEAITRESMSAIFYNQAYYIALNWSNPASTPVGYNNVVLKYDLRNRQWSPPWFLNVSGFMVIDGNLYMTSSTIGRVYKYAGTSDDGANIYTKIKLRTAGNSHEKRNYSRLIATVLYGSVTTASTITTKVGNLSRTIALGACTNWEGSSGETGGPVVSPEKSIAGGRGKYITLTFEDDSTNDVVLQGITVLAEPIQS